MIVAAPAILPPELAFSWPMIEAPERFALGRTIDGNGPAATVVDPLSGVGTWECDLATEALRWSPEVHDLFGLPREASPSRCECVRQYVESSRVVMERLRAHAIRHRRGFTLDAEIRPLTGGSRWMRLIAVPVCADGRVARLSGVKRDVTALYL